MADIKNNYNPKGDSKDTNDEKIRFEAVANGKKGKRSIFDQIYNRFIKEDLTGVREPGILGVIIPSVKKTIIDVMNVFLHPDGKGSYNPNATSKISYMEYWGRNDDIPFKETKPSITTVLDSDLIVFDTRGEAERILSTMDEIIDRYKLITVAGYYEICGIKDANYTANKYGWKDIRSAKIVRTIYNQYQIKLPKAIPLTD